MYEPGPPGAADAPRLSPGEIAYREFAHVPDGLSEDEVRAFLGEVADAVAAGRDRELRLTERVAELEAELAASRGAVSGRPSGSGDAPDPRAEALFARLREEGEAAAAEPEPVEPPPVEPGPLEPKMVAAEHPEPADAEPPRAPEPEPAAEPTPDDGVRARRAEVLDPLVTELMRAAKRLLQDEQNVLLDAARRARSRIDPDRLLPDPAEHRDAWAALLAPGVDAAYTSGRRAMGRSRKASNAPERVLNDLAGGLIAPLRERLATTIASVVLQGPYESPAELHRELVSAIGARYREWRAADLEVRLGDTLSAAYARGAYDGAPSGAHLRWIVDAGQRCPDCEDNSLEPTVKGQSFPTGQPFPPAHPGCRCLVVVVEADRSSTTTRT